MSIEFKINNETLATYTRTSNALEALKVTVGNGQSRLALEVVLDIVNQLHEKLNELESKIDNLSVKENPKKQNTNITEVNSEIGEKDTKVKS